MSPYAIQVSDLWKEYTVGAQRQPPSTFYELLSRALRSPARRSAARDAGEDGQASRFWALRGLDFEIAPGEVFGVVGRNGAGKSTLLKMLSRITAPTRGRITVRGRIASLLEVGTGFHPELTGRENIFLNATILGMTRREIDRKLDAIVAFAGVEKFLDTPVKRYSSGMYVRLAFAVAAHVEADIMLVDEVLAVGDADFQKRCLGLMGDVARGGRTVVFVSHNLTALRNLCTTGLLLERGQLAGMGPIGAVLDQYAGHAASTYQVSVKPGAASAREPHVTRVAVVPASGPDAGPISGIAGMSIEVDATLVGEDNIDVFLHCYNDQQVMVFSSGSFFEDRIDGGPASAGTYTFTCEVPGHLLNDGLYTLDVLLVRDRQEVVTTEHSIISFTVADDFPRAPGWHWRPAGTVRPRLAWRREALHLDAIDSAAMPLEGEAP
ncbi:ABC transporter ATP-binding protein [Caenimonas aquaedulcis]|uniref:ATP-binding cassette domain-containing protein n=1 Tax=Caenimonas aquaedulcis TaxID=2793270 RepID=A0A931MHR0_9BURK|nr:polysaccharide ABC transporter ATP-binding protein [Caenimonas aquaedulcis]MBG9389073.1 ATP-binding cassette domain-containing protein [Caenimonas aquaedulcis]